MKRQRLYPLILHLTQRQRTRETVHLTADHIIDMGPDGGRNGGRILSTGTPEEVSQSVEGYTPTFLAGKWDWDYEFENTKRHGIIMGFSYFYVKTCTGLYWCTFFCLNLQYHLH